MECPFNGLKEKKCFGKCDGIYQMTKNLGASDDFALNYSKYAWKRQMKNKVSDASDDPETSLKGYFKKAISRIANPLANIITGDTYGLEYQISSIERKVNTMESSGVVDPMAYFKKVGEGYGVILKYAGVGSHAPIEMVKKLEGLGNYLGTLISLRDSIIDLRKDKLSGAFNPFKSFNKPEIIEFYKENAKELCNKINDNCLGITADKNLMVKGDAFNNVPLNAIGAYATIASQVICFYDPDDVEGAMNWCSTLDPVAQGLLIAGAVGAAICCLAASKGDVCCIPVDCD